MSGDPQQDVQVLALKQGHCFLADAALLVRRFEHTLELK